MMFSHVPSLTQAISLGSAALLPLCNAAPFLIGPPYPGFRCASCNKNDTYTWPFLMPKKVIKIPDEVANTTLTKRRIPLRVDVEDNVSRQLMVSLGQIEQDPPTIRVTVTNNNPSPVTIYKPLSPLDHNGAILDLLYPVSADGKVTKKDSTPLLQNSPPMTVEADELQSFNNNLLELDAGEGAYRDFNLDIILSKDGDGKWQHRNAETTTLRLMGMWSGVWDMTSEELIQELTDSINSRESQEHLPIVGGYSPGWRWRLRHEGKYESNDLPLELN